MKVEVHFTDRNYKKQLTILYTTREPVVPRIGEMVTIHDCERPLMLKVTRILHEYHIYEDQELKHEIFVELR